ncbi:MAG: hypothetical protein Q8K69_04425 [Bacteroidota bacterium]|nr:hypothetical protein [Bacteroidota bacterium]MDP3433381.1 hypothetical protein [Bacteroidota bacterium]
MKKLYTVIILTIFCLTGLNAQERRGGNPEMFEKIKAEKISFFTSKLDLKPTEAQAFWPVYNELEKKRFDIKRQIHEFERMSDEDFAKLSDSEIEKLTNNYIGSFEKEALLLKDYNKQFLKILPKKKVLMMYRTENEFRSHLIREYKRGQKRE